MSPFSSPLCCLCLLHLSAFAVRIRRARNDFNRKLIYFSEIPRLKIFSVEFFGSSGTNLAILSIKLRATATHDLVLKFGNQVYIRQLYLFPVNCIV